MWNPFKKKRKWVRFYSVQKGVSALQPWIPAKKIKRKWVTDALKKYYGKDSACLLYTSPSPRDGLLSRMPSSA